MLLWVVPAVLQQPARTLNPEEGFEPEAGRDHLVREFVGAVEESRRKALRVSSLVRVSVLPITEVAFNDWSEVRVMEVSVEETGDQRPESWDPHGKNQAPAAQDAARFAESLQAS